MAKKLVRAGNSRAAAKARRARFVEAYVANGGHGRDAYKTAGYTSRKPTIMDVEIWKMLQRPDVKTAIEKRNAESLAKAAEATDLTKEEIMRSLARDIRFDPAKMLDERGQLKPLADMDEDTRLALRGMEHYAEFVGRGEDREQRGTTVKVKFPEKTAAREQGMKHFGLYELDNRQKPAPTVNVGILTVPLEFAKVRARARSLPGA
jgi:hypothetical protein